MRPVTLSLALVLLLVPSVVRADDEVSPPPPPRPSRVRIMAEMGQRWHLDPAHRAFDDNHGGFTPGVAAWVDLNNPDGRLVLALEGSFTATGAEGSLRQSYDTRMTTLAGQLGLVARWHVFEWFAPYIRVAGGVGNHAWRLIPQDNSQPLGRDAWGAVGSAGLGVLVQTPRIFRRAGWRGGRLLVGVEGGMFFATPVDVTVGPPPGDPDPELLGVQNNSLGQVNPSAPYLRVTFGLAL